MCAICFRAQSRTTINREPKSIVISACIISINPEYVSNPQTNSRRRCSRCCSVIGLSVLECTRPRTRRDRITVRQKTSPGTCDEGSRCPRVRSIIRRPRRSKPPLRAGQLAPQSVSPAWRNAFASLSPTALVPKHTYIRTHAQPLPHARSICYNKSTILAPTRDDSIGRRERSIVLAPFWESRVSASRLEHDAPVIVGTSSTCYSPLTLDTPSRSITRPAIRGWQTTVDLPLRKREGGGRGKPTAPSKRLCSTALLPSSEIVLARNGSGSWAVELQRSFFSFSLFSTYRNSIGDDSRAYPSVDISTASDDGNLKKIRDVPQLASFSRRRRGRLTH